MKTHLTDCETPQCFSCFPRANAKARTPPSLTSLHYVSQPTLPPSPPYLTCTAGTSTISASVGAAGDPSRSGTWQHARYALIGRSPAMSMPAIAAMSGLSDNQIHSVIYVKCTSSHHRATSCIWCCLPMGLQCMHVCKHIRCIC